VLKIRQLADGTIVHCSEVYFLLTLSFTKLPCKKTAERKSMPLRFNTTLSAVLADPSSLILLTLFF